MNTKTKILVRKADVNIQNKRRKKTQKQHVLKDINMAVSWIKRQLGKKTIAQKYNCTKRHLHKKTTYQ